MENEAKLEKMAAELIDKLLRMNPETEEYRIVNQRLQEVQRMLAEETKRNSSLEELQLEKRRLALEQDKFENEVEQQIERQTEEEKKRKDGKLARWGQAGIELLKVVGGTAGTLLLMFGGVALNNSGHVIPPMANKALSFPKLFK